MSETTRPNLAPLAKMSIWSGIPYELNGFEWVIDKNAVNGGLRFEPNELTVGETYTISYRIQKKSGTLKTIRGHCQEGFTTISWSIDGVVQTDTYNSNAAAPNVADDDTIHYVVFTGVYKATGSQNGFFIQPNRMQGVNVVVAVWDFKVELGDTATAWIPAEEDMPTEPEAATLDPTALLMGWLMGKRVAGMRTKKEPVAYLYNGVRLPKLPEWDRETYPYAMISGPFSSEENPEYGVVYFLKLLNKSSFYYRYGTSQVYEWRFGSNRDNPFSIMDTYSENSGGPWDELLEAEFGSVVIYASHEVSSPLHWANFDVLDEDGNVYLAASDPVPVYA